MAQASNSDENAINLTTIQKTDMHCCDVLDKCTSSALYRYAQGKWEKCNCDGVFLLYKRSAPPAYAFIVLNKRSTQNHVQHITKAMGLQLQPPFLLYRTEAGDIHGMWFFTPRDCQRIAARVGQLVVSLGGEPLRVAGDRAATATATVKGKPAAPPAGTATKQQQQQPTVPTAPASAPAMAAAGGAEVAQSILQMLSRAQTDFKHRPQQQQQQQPPKVISVDSLFAVAGGGQQSQRQQLGNGAPPPPQRDQYAEMSYQIKEHLGLVTTAVQRSQPPQPHQPQAPPQPGSREASCSQEADDEEEEFLLTPGMLECAANQLLTDCPQPTMQQQSPPQPQQLPHHSLTPLSSQPKPASSARRREFQPPAGADDSTARGGGGSGSGDIPSLTKEQLRESLVYLLETDEAFLGALHSAYAASLQRRLSRI